MSSSLESGRPPTRNVTGRVAKLSAARIHRACASSARSAAKRPPVAARSAASSAETRAAEPAKRTASNHRSRRARAGDMSSWAAGFTAAAAMSWATWVRSSRDPSSTSVWSARGRARSRRCTSTITPNAPNPPAASLVRSYPATFFITRPPLCTKRPSPVTKVTPSRWSRTGPNPCRNGPAVAVATTDPRVRPASPGGSSASHVPRSASCWRSRSQPMPASAVAERSCGSIAGILSSRRVVSAKSAGASAGSHVPAPSTRTRHPSSRAVPSSSPTASGDPGATRGTPSGVAATSTASSPSSARTRSTRLMFLMRNAECGMRNRRANFYSAFRIPHSALLTIHDEVTRQAAHGAERLLAALPQPLPLLRVRGAEHTARPVRAEDVRDRVRVRRHGFLAAAVELDQQHRRGITWVARRVHRIFHGIDARLVHHLQSSGHDAARDHGGHGLARRPQRVEVGEQRADGARHGQQAHPDAGSDPEIAFRADEQAYQVGPPRLTPRAAELHNLSVGEHDLESEHVGRRHAVLEAVRPAGVFGHVPADGAGGLTRRLGAVIQPVGRRRSREAHVHDAGLHHREPVHGIDRQDAVQPREHHQDRVGVRERAPGQTGAGAPGYERHAQRGEQAHDRDHPVPASGQHDHAGNAPRRRAPVARVRDSLGERGTHVARADDLTERRGQRFPPLPSPSGGHVARSISGWRPPRPLPRARWRTTARRSASAATGPSRLASWRSRALVLRIACSACFAGASSSSDAATWNERSWGSVASSISSSSRSVRTPSARARRPKPSRTSAASVVTSVASLGSSSNSSISATRYGRVLEIQSLSTKRRSPTVRTLERPSGSGWFDWTRATQPTSPGFGTGSASGAGSGAT